MKRTSHRRFAALALASFTLGGGAGAFGYGRAAASTREVPDAGGAPVVLTSAAVPAPGESAPDATQVDGRAFPDGVLALTWDDGPDANTLALAEYLADEKVSASFFVVSEWVAGLSSDPGSGHGVYETGYQAIPILGDLVKLGHRLGNHTLNHVLLDRAEPALVDLEVRANQAQLDPFLTNELRMFRVPGGAWSAEAAKIVTDDPALRGMVGPIRWDVDRKDWDNSVTCREEHPTADCERTPSGAMRVRARVTAARYLASIDEAKRGIVLFHDRVGDVGSDYALQIARLVVPALEARGYVFAAPVLAFSPLRVRAGVKPPSTVAERATGDLNGDGRLDECTRVPEGIACALRGPTGLTRATLWTRDVSVPRFWLADINGDARVDLCVGAGGGGDVACGLAP